MEDSLAHYGVKGMKWGVRRDRRNRARTAAAIKKIAPDYSDRLTSSGNARRKMPYDYASRTLLRDISNKEIVRGTRYLNKHPNKAKKYEDLAREAVKRARKELAKADANRDYRFVSPADHKAEQKRRRKLSVSESEAEVERLKWGLYIGNDKAFNTSLKTYQEIRLYAVNANKYDSQGENSSIKKIINRDMYLYGGPEERSEVNGLVLKELGYKDTPKSRNDIDMLVMPQDLDDS